MVADTAEELHVMALAIGLKRAWFQSDSSIPHYDLRPMKRAYAVSRGAIKIDNREMVRRFHPTFAKRMMPEEPKP